MKSFSLCWILLLFCLVTQAQNLVPNPSFELHSSCPTDFSQTAYATGWYSYNTPDYFNICASSPNVQVPTNYFGFQYPSTGAAYGGFFTFTAGGEYHEFLYAQLSSPCIIGQRYNVSFKVSPADLSFCVFSNKIGAKFFKNLPSSIVLNNSAHIFSNSIITDTANWSGIGGSFVADSAYQYVVFGNFFSDANTSAIDPNCGSPASYYFIDDVCVSPDPNLCNSIIPINMLSFDVVPGKGSMFISWKTAQESNNKGFEIQRSIGDSKHFKPIGFIEGKGFSSTQSQYSFSDREIYSNSIYYYRLKQIDFDNRFWYSVIKKTQSAFNPKSIILITPNPAQDIIELKFKSLPDQEFTIRITDYLGKEIYKINKRYSLNGENLKIDVSKFPRGAYFVQCQSAADVSTQELILK